MSKSSEKNRKTILVTGSNGFIAQATVRKLIQNNRVLGIDRNASQLVNENYVHLKKDLNSPILFDDLFFLDENPDVVLNFAGINLKGGSYEEKLEMIRLNTLFNGELLKWSIENEVENFFYISTGGLYGFTNHDIDEESKIRIENDYCLSKYLGEKITEYYSPYIKSCILRLFFPYGPGIREPSLFYRLIRKSLERQSIELNDGGGPVINPIYIYIKCKSRCQNAVIINSAHLRTFSLHCT